MSEGEHTGELVQTETVAGEIEVIKIKHGQKIDRDGIYDMPMLWYHSDCCVGPSISSTGLRKIRSYSPAHYWDTSPLNPERADEDPADEDNAEWLRIGRAAHTLLLEPAHFKQLFSIRPPIFDSYRSKDARKWRAEQQAEGFTVLDPAELLRVQGVHAALKRHPLYQQGLLEGDIERSLIWKDKKSGIWLKARPDVIPRGSNIFADLKVVGDARARQLSRKIFDIGYDQQMALAGVGMWEILRRAVEEYTLVAVESERPHGIRIAPIGHEEIVRALSLLRWSIDKFAACLAANDWPSFEDEDNTYVWRSDWEAKAVDEAIKRGELPKEF